MRRPPCSLVFFFNDTATTEIYTLSLHDALPISREALRRRPSRGRAFAPRCLSHQPFSDRSEERSGSRYSRPRSEEHTSELQSLAYLVCRLLLEKKKINKKPSRHIEIHKRQTNNS